MDLGSLGVARARLLLASLGLRFGTCLRILRVSEFHGKHRVGAGPCDLRQKKTPRPLVAYSSGYPRARAACDTVSPTDTGPRGLDAIKFSLWLGVADFLNLWNSGLNTYTFCNDRTLSESKRDGSCDSLAGNLHSWSARQRHCSHRVLGKAWKVRTGTIRMHRSPILLLVHCVLVRISIRLRLSGCTLRDSSFVAMWHACSSLAGGRRK